MSSELLAAHLQVKTRGFEGKLVGKPQHKTFFSTPERFDKCCKRFGGSQLAGAKLYCNMYIYIIVCIYCDVIIMIILYHSDSHQ